MNAGMDPGSTGGYVAPKLEAASLVKVPEHLLLFDGVCGMCDGFVQRMLKLDTDERFIFAPLQGETVDLLRMRYPEIPDNLDSIVYIDRGVVYVFSDAILEAAKQLPSPWRWGANFLIVPKPIRNAIYKFIARNRYSVFGTLDSCRIPSGAEIARFLP